MEFHLNPDAVTPLFRQLATQIHYAINAGELAPGAKLPSIRQLARAHGVAANTVAKALRHLADEGLLAAEARSGFRVVASPGARRYQARGVSADKAEVHRAVDHLDRGLFPGAFCKVTPDYISGDPDRCCVIHSDGSGTKSIIAYLHYRETGDPSVFEGIAQDSIVMNLDDLLCVGVRGPIALSNTINRNAINCPGEVISALIDGSESFVETMRGMGVEIRSGGGETADVGDLTGTVVVDSCAVTLMQRSEVITGEGIVAGLSIVGLSSTGQAAYEHAANSGIGSNGLTSARHDLLGRYYAERYPETHDRGLDPALVYCGPYRLEDALPESAFTVGGALLSPTRTYAPVIGRLLREMPAHVQGIIHCSGGGQTKCLKFGRPTGDRGIHFVKDNLFPIPAIFRTIQTVSQTDWQEMYQVYNMGHRMEVYCHPRDVDAVVALAAEFGIDAQQVGFTEPASGTGNELTVTDGKSRYRYQA